MTVVKQELFAFWQYDSYPYFLGSEISEILHDGRIKATSYGNATFQPTLILPKEEGVKLLKILNDLNKGRDKDIKEIDSHWNAKLPAILTKFFAR